MLTKIEFIYHTQINNNICNNLILINNLISQIKSKHNFNKNKLDKLLQKYEKFLVIRNAKNNSKPSDNVRLIWKQHILDTKHYADYCNKKFGKIVHYDPNEEYESEEEEEESDEEDISDEDEEYNKNNSNIQLVIKTLTLRRRGC